MLILTRNISEKIIIDDNIKITVLDVNRNQVKLGIDAPSDVSVDREEIWNQKHLASDPENFGNR